MTILMSIFVWFLIIVLLGLLVLFSIWAWGGVKAKVPFVPVPNSILKDIYKSLGVKDDSVVYDLGCGDGRILFFCAKSNPNAKYIGIENAPFPVILSRFRSWIHKLKTGNSVIIKNGNFFNYNFGDASHIFTYLYPNVMDDLLPKLEKELKSGTRLVSVTFKFTSKHPIAEIDLARSKYKLARKIYIYEF